MLFVSLVCMRWLLGGKPSSLALPCCTHCTELELPTDGSWLTPSAKTGCRFTSAAASLASVSFGAVQWDYATALFGCSLVSTVAGQLATKHIIRRLHGRSSVIIFGMAAVLGASTLVLAVQGSFDSLAAFERHIAWAWGSVCPAAPLE